MIQTSPRTKIDPPTIVDLLNTDGIGTSLPNNFDLTRNPVKLDEGIRLIEEHRKSNGLPVAILGQIFTSVSPFHGRYRLYALNRAQELAGTKPYGNCVVTEGYLERRKARYSPPEAPAQTSV